MNTSQNPKSMNALAWLVDLALIFALLLIAAGPPASASSLAAEGWQASASSDDLQSYIFQGSSTDQVAQLVEQNGGVVTSRLDIINGVAALLSPDAARKLASEAGLWVTPNSKMSVENLPVAIQGKDDKSTPATDYPDVVGADTVWAAGVTGQGVTVALLDTGMAKLSGLVKSSTSKGNRILAWSDFIENKDKAKDHLIDPNGHGTHIAGVIANSERGSDDEWNGVAPGVSLVVGRVADEQGYATYETLLSGSASCSMLFRGITK